MVDAEALAMISAGDPVTYGDVFFVLFVFLVVGHWKEFHRIRDAQEEDRRRNMEAQKRANERGYYTPRPND